MTPPRLRARRRDAGVSMGVSNLGKKISVEPYFFLLGCLEGRGQEKWALRGKRVVDM